MQCRCLQGSEAIKESPEHQHKDTQTSWKARNVSSMHAETENMIRAALSL